jgi:hypothetical protein
MFIKIGKLSASRNPCESKTRSAILSAGRPPAADRGVSSTHHLRGGLELRPHDTGVKIVGICYRLGGRRVQIVEFIDHAFTPR